VESKIVDRVGNILTGAQGKRLLAIQNTQRVTDKVQEALASGNDVNSALDDPQKFFLSRSLTNRSKDLAALLDGLAQNIRAVEIASSGTESVMSLLDQAETLLKEAELTLFQDIEPNILPEKESDIIIYNPSQSFSGEFGLSDDNTELRLEGDMWLRTALDYEITESTVLRFDYKVTDVPAISAIGFDNDAVYVNDSDRFFLSGTRRPNAIPYAAPENTFLHSGSADFETIEIAVGEYFTGDFSHITFIHDSLGPGRDGDVTFKNLTLFEGVVGGDTDVLVDQERLAEFEQDYLGLLDQIDSLTQDANYRGVNLLKDEDLVSIFNEGNTSSLTIDGLDATASGLGINYATISKRSHITTFQDQIRDARETVRNYSQSIASDLSVLTVRKDYTRSLVNTLIAGSGDLTLADQNEKGAEFLALQTRQQIQFSVLTLFNTSIAEFLS